VRVPELTYANVTASLALFIALGGTSYAVTQLPRHSVGNRQLKPNAVTSSKIRNGAVSSADLSSAARRSARGPRGAQGPAGPAGAAGPSETVQAKRPDVVEIPNGGGGSARLASLTLDPGAWSLDAQTSIFYSVGQPGSEFFDCQLHTAAGDALVRAVMRIGNDASGAEAGVIPLHVASQFSVSTQVVFTCAHPSSIAGQPHAERTVLRATRLGRLDDR